MDSINYWAVLVAAIAQMVLGFLWYGPLFGKAWARAMGLPEGMKPSTAEIVKGSLLNLLGAFLTAYVLAYQIAVWRPSTWHAGADGPASAYGSAAAFFIWIGFIVPMLLNGVSFERKGWKFFGINGLFQFLSLLAMAMILASWP